MPEVHNIGNNEDAERVVALSDIYKKLDDLYRMVSEMRESLAELTVTQAYRDREMHDIWLKIDEQGKDITNMKVQVTELKGTTTNNSTTINRWIDIGYKVIIAIGMLAMSTYVMIK